MRLGVGGTGLLLRAMSGYMALMQPGSVLMSVASLARGDHVETCILG